LGKTTEKCEDDPDRLYQRDSMDEPGVDYPDLISPEQTMFETERACSLRLKPGSIYFVDALTNDITRSFRERLGNENLTQRFLEAQSQADKEHLIIMGRELFAKTIEEVKRKRKICTGIPNGLADYAELRGELVFFKDKPVFKKYPSASFRGILEIDGDHIIDQVSAGETELEIRYCDEKWISKLAQNTKSGKAYVEFFLKELKSNELFKVSNFGKYYVITTKEKKGRHPQTRETITVPAKKRVRFTPYENLRKYEESDSKDESSE
jgi:nucleoid DNA-binding protein